MKLITYTGYVPPNAAFCGGCPAFQKKKKPCPGADKGAKLKACHKIYKCCVEKKGLRFCHECDKYPCKKEAKFIKEMKEYGQKLPDNMKMIKKEGVESFLDEWNKKVDDEN
jgi:hypothetical protein